MYGLAITPKARGDEQKLSALLTKIAEEDPTFKWHTDRQTHEVVINGLGELHLRLVLEKLSNRGLHVDTKPPKIAYRETIQQTADGHHRHKKQTGGAGQFGEVFLRVEPLDGRLAPPQGQRRQRAGDRQRGLRRHHPRPVHPGGRKGHPRPDGPGRRSPATRCRTSASRSPTASTTRSTARKSPSARPASSRSRTRC